MIRNTANKNIILVCIAFFWIFFGFNGALQYLLPLLALKNLQSLAYVSQIILYVVFLLTSIFGAQLINRVGLKKAIIGGAFFYALYVLTLTTFNTTLIYLASLLIGVGATLLWISSAKIITNSSASHEVGKNLGLQYASFLLGTLGGTFLGGVLISSITFTSLYFIFTTTVLISLPFLIMLQISETKLKQVPFNPTYLFEKVVVLIFPIAYASAFILSQTFNAMNLVILQASNIATVGMISTILRVVMVLASYFLGKMSDQMNKVSLLYFLVTSGLMGVGLFLISDLLLVIICGIVLIGIFISSTYATCLSLLKLRLSEEKYTLAIGAFQVYITFAVLSAILSTWLLPAKLSFLPGIAALGVSFLSLRRLGALK